MTPPRRYTDAEKAAALDVLRAEGLAAAARHSGAAKSTIKAWAAAAGITPDDYATAAARSATERATAASAAARTAATVEKRATLAELLLDRNAQRAAELIADRLTEEADAAAKVADASARLDSAILALEVLNAPDDPDDPATPEERAARQAMRKDARQAVTDARLNLLALRAGRAKLPELVGVLTRAVHDHLRLLGDLDAVDDGAPFAITLTAPRPARQPLDVVTLDPDPQDAPTP